MLLLTTPDYLPKLGGLSSHTLNVEKVLKDLGIEYELFNWKSYNDILSYPKQKIKKFDYILNIHSGFHMYMPESDAKVINFINGAEILFYSPNVIKHFIKVLTKKNKIRRLEKAHTNIFISDFTFQTLIRKGLHPDFSRDLIYHMAIDTSGHSPSYKNWNSDPLKFICVARDVPHKNFAGAIQLCETVQEISRRPVEFITVTNNKFHSDKIKVRSYVNPDNKLRDDLLKEAHINLLLSLDNSHKGFFEGFGQVVQEAGCFATPSIVLATGGLPESVHHNHTGWVLKDTSSESIKNWWSSMNSESYAAISKNCYEHTIDCHGLSSWKKLFGEIIK